MRRLLRRLILGRLVLRRLVLRGLILGLLGRLILGRLILGLLGGLIPTLIGGLLITLLTLVIAAGIFSRTAEVNTAVDGARPIGGNRHGIADDKETDKGKNGENDGTSRFVLLDDLVMYQYR